MRQECRERFPSWPSNSKESASWQSRHAPRHVRHARPVVHVGIVDPRWWRKRSRHSRRMRNPQFHVSDKRPMATLDCPMPANDLLWWGSTYVIETDNQLFDRLGYKTHISAKLCNPQWPSKCTVIHIHNLGMISALFYSWIFTRNSNGLVAFRNHLFSLPLTIVRRVMLSSDIISDRRPLKSTSQHVQIYISFHSKKLKNVFFFEDKEFLTGDKDLWILYNVRELSKQIVI